MNFDQYFQTRADLTTRVLLDASGERPFAIDWRFYGAGLVCLVSATALVLWLSVNQSDAGYFARTTTFLEFVLLAGLWLLTIAQAADFLLVRFAISSREAVKEKTLRQLLNVDVALARRLADGSG